MRTPTKLDLLLSLLFITIILFFNTNSLYAQTSSLPEGWCQQPSDVQLQHEYGHSNGFWIQRIGVSAGGIRALYQPYNQRIVLQRTEPRELVQIIEDNVVVTFFDENGFTANCRYLVATLSDTEGRSGVAVYDLLNDVPGRMGTIWDAGRTYWSVESNPEGDYLLVTAMNGLYLWNLETNTQTFLTSLIRSDCELRPSGCVGNVTVYREARWDVPHGLVQLDLVSNITVTLNLPSASINRVEPTYPARMSQSEAETRAVAYTSQYACRPEILYQTYNRRLTLTNWLDASELVAVVEDGLDLSGFQALGWSATCRYIAAAIEDANGIRLAVWNVETGTRQEHPISDWVDSARWLTIGDVISVRTDGEQFEWNVSGQ